MKNHIISISLILLIVYSICLVCSCTDKDVIYTDEQLVEEIIDDVFIEWNTDKDVVKKHMNKYQLLSVGNDYIVYSHSKGNGRIVYGFINNKLSAAIIQTNNNNPLLFDLGTNLDGYSLVGEINGATVYEKSSINSLAFIETLDYDSLNTTIGFAPIESDLFPTLPPIVVETGDVSDVKSVSASVSGKVKGIDDNIEAGIIYGKKNALTETEGNRVSTNSNGDFTVELTKLYDASLYYYRAFAVIDGIYYWGDVKSFITDTLTYSFTDDDRIFKMIHITDAVGLQPFAIMQTELPPCSEMVVNDKNMGKISHWDENPVITRSYLRSILDKLYEETGIEFRQCTADEWLYVASAGKQNYNYKYTGSDNLNEVGWYKSNSGAKAHQVAQKKPNELGIYDLCGNYAEIVLNEIKRGDDNLIKIDVDGRMYGGSWNSYSDDCRVTSYKPGVKTNHNIPGTGFTETGATSLKEATVRLAYTIE